MVETLESMVELVKGFVGDSGVCSYDRAVKAINQARRLLWNKKEWNATGEYACICCANDCFTLPNRYEQIKLAWIGKNAVSLADEWFNATNAFGLTAQNSCHRQITEVGGKHVVFREYTEAPYQIGISIEEQDDIGVEIVFEAQDQFSTYKNVTIAATNPPQKAYSTEFVTGLRSVTKPKTKGRVRVYAYNPNNGQKLLLAVYQPSDINPSFRRFRLPRTCEQVTIYAMKRYYDLELPTDLVEFGPDAMIYAILALNSRENRKAQEFINNLNIAVAEAEKEMEGDEIPTAGPLRIANMSRPENLVGDYWGYPSNSDYFLRP